MRLTLLKLLFVKYEFGDGFQVDTRHLATPELVPIPV